MIRPVDNGIEDIPLEGTLADYKAFVESAVWRDLRDFLKQRIDIQHKVLEEADDLRVVKRAQGIIALADDIINLFGEGIINDLSQQKQG